jgi:hypothetical protein
MFVGKQNKIQRETVKKEKKKLFFQAETGAGRKSDIYTWANL